jgi:Flp pilus assembly protein TadG
VKGPNERGAVTVFVVVFMLALMLVAGLVFDGGNVLAARQEAANVASSAARAGAQALDVAAARSSSGTPLDASAAIARADSYLSQTGYSGVASVHGNQVLVEVTITQETFLLGLAGIASMTVHGRGEAHGLRAVEQEGN